MKYSYTAFAKGSCFLIVVALLMLMTLFMTAGCGGDNTAQTTASTPTAVTIATNTGSTVTQSTTTATVATTTEQTGPDQTVASNNPASSAATGTTGSIHLEQAHVPVNGVKSGNTFKVSAIVSGDAANVTAIDQVKTSAANGNWLDITEKTMVLGAPAQAGPDENGEILSYPNWIIDFTAINPGTHRIVFVMTAMDGSETTFPAVYEVIP